MNAWEKQLRTAFANGDELAVCEIYSRGFPTTSPVRLVSGGGYTAPVLLMAEMGMLKALEHFVGIGGELDAKDRATGETALLQAAKAGNQALVDTLIEFGADKFERDQSCKGITEHAIQSGNYALLKHIIQAHSQTIDQSCLQLAKRLVEDAKSN